MAEKILTTTDHDGQVVRVTLNAPKANILDAEMMGQLQAVLDGLKENRRVKLITFTGVGDHFCFGASVQEHTRENAPAMLENFHALFYTLADLAIPTVALVSGQCLGGGLELALMCNLLFVDKSASLGQPEISLAVFPPPASVILPLKIGQARADDLLITGRSITADDAHAIGLAARCFDTRAEMHTGVEEWIGQQIIPKSASSLRFATRAARQNFNTVLRKQLPLLQKMYVEQLMATHDANEGIASFLERRRPEWEEK